jgi:hypothetical protein
MNEELNKLCKNLHLNAAQEDSVRFFFKALKSQILEIGEKAKLDVPSAADDSVYPIVVEKVNKTLSDFLSKIKAL